MPQSPGIVTATAAFAKDRAGQRGSGGPAPRQERSLVPDDVPDVSVGMNDYPGDGPASPIHTASSTPFSARSEANPDTANRYEAILLGPGENKIDVEVDTRLPSACIFTFHKEDHTLGNMLRTRLLKTAHVTFAAYRVPHPLTPNFQLRVQTDGEVTPRQAVINASEALIKDLGTLSREFTKEYELRKMANAANQQQNAD